MSTLRSNYSSSSPNGTYYSAPWDDRSKWANMPPLQDLQQLHVNGQQEVTEATQIVDILRRRIAYLSGGRDRRGGPILTFPAQNIADASDEDIIATISYLVIIPSEESIQKGFTILIDNRQGSYSKNLKSLLSLLQQCLGANIHTVFIVGGDKQRLSLSFRSKDRNAAGSEPQNVSVQKLPNYISPSQLTAEFDGELDYRHDLWLNNRISYERFLRDGQATSQHLDRLVNQVTERLRRDRRLTPMDLLRQHREFIESELEMPQQVVREGRALYDNLKTDAESGFPSPEDANYTLDQVVAMNQIKRTVDELENKLDKIQEMWTDRERELGVNVQLSELEEAMKTVIDWILGPGEKLLSSQVDIGDTYQSAEELRKQHEQLELKCTDTYATYAELRHRTEKVLEEGTHEQPEDLKAQRDYMDIVCRSFAARLERRRNLVITSVRFHRLAEEVSVMLDELLSLVCGEVVADDVAAAEEALKTLQQKCDEINMTCDQALNEGQNLLDQLSLPVKDSSGKDISPDHTKDSEHVERVMEDLQARKLRCDELADVRKLKLQQILQLRTCERDAEQAILWIIELCEVTITTQIQVAHTSEEADVQQLEQKKLEETAKSTYEYGKQLLQAALVLRRSLRYDLDPNHNQAQRLNEAWKRFSVSINERASRLNTTAMFHRDADLLLERIEKLLVIISRSVNLEITVEELVTTYTITKRDITKDYQNVKTSGEDLISRLAMPLLTDEGGEKRMQVEDNEISEVVSRKLSLLSRKVSEMNRSWDQHTKGLHLGPDGQLLGPDGQPVSMDRRRSGRSATETETVTVEKTVTTSLSGAAPPRGSKDQEWQEIERQLREVSKSIDLLFIP